MTLAEAPSIEVTCKFFNRDTWRRIYTLPEQLGRTDSSTRRFICNAFGSRVREAMEKMKRTVGNDSMCRPVVKYAMNGSSVDVTVYNPAGWEKVEKELLALLEGDAVIGSRIMIG